MAHVVFNANINTSSALMQRMEQAAFALAGVQQLLLRGVNEGYIRDEKGIAVGTFKLSYHTQEQNLNVN